MDASAKAAVALTKAQATQIYAGLGLWPVATTARLVEAQVIADGIYPGAEAVFAEAVADRLGSREAVDAFPVRSEYNQTQPRDPDGRWSSGAGDLPNARLSLVSDPEKAKRRFEEGLAGGPGPLDDPIAPAAEDPITDPFPRAASHGPLESVPAPLAGVPILPRSPSAQSSSSAAASKTPTVAMPPIPARKPTLHRRVV